MKPEHLRDLFRKQKVAGNYTLFLESIACSLAKYRQITADVLSRAVEDAQKSARRAQ